MKRDASEVIAEMRSRAKFLLDRGDDFLNVEAEKMDDWANRLAAAEPADAGRDAVAEAGNDGSVVWLTVAPPKAGTKLYTRPPSEDAAGWIACVDRLPDFDQRVIVWRDGELRGPGTQCTDDVRREKYATDGKAGWSNTGGLERVTYWHPFPTNPPAALASQQAVKP